jgi:outer membrane protein, multidrug efflux system
VRRPDILAAEHNLRAANASIGAARAAFFPSIALAGNYGTASTQLSGLIDQGSTAWTFSPQISLPILAAGAHVASLDLAKVQKNITIVQYEQAIQVAFREVSSAAARSTTRSRPIRRSSRRPARAVGCRTCASATASTTISACSIRSARCMPAQQTLVGVKLSRLHNLVTLYKTLGGGWSEHSPQNAGAVAGTAPLPASRTGAN